MGKKWNAILRGEIKLQKPFLIMHPGGFEWVDKKLGAEIQGEWREDTREVLKKNWKGDLICIGFLVLCIAGLCVAIYLSP